MPIHAPFLKYFREVARSGSVRLAAKRLYVASSAVNRQILKIEDELGVKLFERTPTGMVLTAAGSLLSAHVERVLSDAERTLAEIASAARGEERPITITGEDSVLCAFLPPALARLCGEYPQVCVAFKAASGRDFSRLLSIGAADVALGFDAEPALGLECVASCELPVGAIVHGDHPLAERSRVTLEECAAYPMILPDRSWPLRDLMDQHVARLAVEPTTVTSSSSVEFLRFMLERQNGVGFCTIIAIEAQVASGELRHLPLFAPDAVVQQFGIWAVANERRGRHLETLLTLLSGRLGEYGCASES
jgi:DNA-binding transcriptional LysR family regulator